MQASASNGFMSTKASDCSGVPFNFQPEYNTAAKANIIPWAAIQADISTEFETGHFEACTSLSDPLPNFFDSNDTMCYPAGDTHPGFDGPGSSTAPVQVSHCQDNVFQNGDLDFDGTPYWKEWPTSLAPNLHPGSFLEQFPTTNGRQYSQFFFQTDVALSESTCTGNNSGCTVPPKGPGGFYPYWTQLHAFSECALEFGNVAGGFGGLNSFGQDAQYGTNQFPTLGLSVFFGLQIACGKLNTRCGSYLALTCVSRVKLAP
jgi:hypothetical protein